VLTFALDTPAELAAESGSVRVDWGAEGFRTRFTARHQDREHPLELRLAGTHNVRNALAAAAAALAMGVGMDAVRSGLLSLAPVPGRLCPLRCNGVRVIDDTYNANPDSIAAAVSVLVGLPGRRWLVLGDLGELGGESRALHREVGARAREAGVSRLTTVGAQSAEASAAFGEGARHFDDQERLAAYLRESLGADDVALVKGSRAARMEGIVRTLCGRGDD
jgi:UDP-N-acetylmuramoyl-tripeptide--D-alanyl-D-alanine ligase